MTPKIYIILVLLPFSHFAFGQDSLVIKKTDAHGHIKGLNLDSILRSEEHPQRDFSLVITDTVSLLEQTSKGYSGAQNFRMLVQKHRAISKDTIYLYINEYKLTQTETDSVWNTIFRSTHTQNLLKAYQATGLTDELLRPENYNNLMSVFKSKNISYRTKQDLLIDKIHSDDRTIPKSKTTPPGDIVYPNGYYEPMPHINRSVPKEENPYLITIPFLSKEQALSDYLKILNRNISGNFSQALITYASVNNRRRQVRNLVISKDAAMSQKTTRKIRRLKVTGVEFFPPFISRPLFSNKETNGALLIQYIKR